MLQLFFIAWHDVSCKRKVGSRENLHRRCCITELEMCSSETHYLQSLLMSVRGNVSAL